jgi:hypothetical protein
MLPVVPVIGMVVDPMNTGRNPTRLRPGRSFARRAMSWVL